MAAATPPLGPISHQGLTQDQARQILLFVLQHERIGAGRSSPTVEFLTSRSGGELSPGYYSMGVTTEDPSAGASTVQGLFAISRATGDVWEVNLCRHFVFAALQETQKVIMARTGKTFTDERSLLEKLGCTPPSVRR